MTHYEGYSADAQREAAGARSDAAAAQNKVRDLTNRLERLTLVCAALWELLKEKANLTEDDLITRIAILDAKDGEADGKLSQKVTKCPKCSRTMAPRAPKCMYCGSPRIVNSIFETI